MDSRDVRALRAAIREVEESNFIFAFTSEEVEAAKRLLKSLERIEALKEAVVKLNQKTMLELRNYSDPPKLVHRVMKAALVLLGDELKVTTVSLCTLFSRGTKQHGQQTPLKRFKLKILLKMAITVKET